MHKKCKKKMHTQVNYCTFYHLMGENLIVLLVTLYLGHYLYSIKDFGGN